MVEISNIWSGGLSILSFGLFALGGLFFLALFLAIPRSGVFLAFAFSLLASALASFIDQLPFLPGIELPLFDPELLHFLGPQLQLLGHSILFAAILGTRAKILPRAALLFAPLALATAGILLPGYRGDLELATLVWYALLLLFALGICLRAAFRGSRLARGCLPALPFPPLAAFLAWYLPASSTLSPFLEAGGFILFDFVLALALLKNSAFHGEELLSDRLAEVSTTAKRFIPPEFLAVLEKRDFMELKLGDHVKKGMTILFLDIRAFTELSESLTAEENFAFINSYLARVVPVVKRHGGYVDKYEGDAIMALFPGPRGADEAIRASVEMQATILEYNAHRASSGYRPIALGIGIHTGELMLGVVGVGDRMENTIVSDAVKLASRLQAITKTFGISLAVSEQTFKALEDPGAYRYRFIGKVRVKGKLAPISVFEIYDGIEPSLLERKMKADTFFEQGMLAYYQKDFAGAMYYFKRVLDLVPEDGAATFYLEHCMDKASL